MTPTLNRRAILCWMGTVALTGCIGGQSSHNLAGEDAWSGGEETARDGDSFEGTLTLDEGEYYGFDASLSNAVDFTCEHSVQSGGPIDVVVFEPGSYSEYRDRADLELEENLRITGRGELESAESHLGGMLPEGNYVIAFDNTGVYGATPDGQVVVQVLIEFE